MKFNEVHLGIQLKHDNVTSLTLHQGLEVPPEDFIYRVTEVDSEQVCSLICMARPRVTSWTYGNKKNVSGICSCMKLEKLSACNKIPTNAIEVVLFIREELAQYSCKNVCSLLSKLICQKFTCCFTGLTQYFSARFIRFWGQEVNYTGVAINGKAHGNGTGVSLLSNKLVTFVGTWFRGDMNGLGHAKASNWEYNGFWRTGRFHGAGKLDYTTDDTLYYEGKNLNI